MMKTILAAACCGAAIQAQAVPYSVTDIGSLGGETTSMGLNELGQVVGYSQTKPGGDTHAFLFSAGVIQDLGTLGGTSSYAVAINNMGTVVGTSELALGSSVRQAFRYQAGTMSNLTPHAGESTYASALNDAGLIVGSTQSSQIFLAQGNGLAQMQRPPLGGSYSWVGGINDAGTAVGGSGSTTGDGLVHAYVYQIGIQGAQAVDIFEAGQWLSQGRDINNHDVIVGVMEHGGWIPHAFIYANGVYTDLGTGGLQYSEAFAINDDGLVVGRAYDQGLVGSRAFLYDGDGFAFLDTLVDYSLGLRFRDAYGINNAGQIIANGIDGHAYLLTPVPEPTSAVLAGLGFCVIAGRRRLQRRTS